MGVGEGWGRVGGGVGLFQYLPVETPPAERTTPKTQPQTARRAPERFLAAGQPRPRWLAGGVAAPLLLLAALFTAYLLLRPLLLPLLAPDSELLGICQAL